MHRNNTTFSRSLSLSLFLFLFLFFLPSYHFTELYYYSTIVLYSYPLSTCISSLYISIDYILYIDYTLYYILYTIYYIYCTYCTTIPITYFVVLLGHRQPMRNARGKAKCARLLVGRVPFPCNHSAAHDRSQFHHTKRNATDTARASSMTG